MEIKKQLLSVMPTQLAKILDSALDGTSWQQLDELRLIDGGSL